MAARWWHSAVVYQVYPRSFADSDGDGLGDLRGVVSKLDHVQRLGVDVIWLSPVYRSPQADNGYDISDYYDIDPRFGSLESLDELIEEVHARGMKLIMDLVVNHTSDEHPWFQASRDPNSPFRDWYWWRDARPDHEAGTPGAEPTNWESYFSGPTWTFDEASGQYYLHLFGPKQPDLNWENPEVREAIYEMMRWWLDRGIDGFRMDVINLISKDPALPDGEPLGEDPGALGDGTPFFVSGPRIHEFMSEMYSQVLQTQDLRLLTVAETPGVSIEDARLFTDAARHEVNMVFGFDHVGLDRGADKFDVVPRDLVTLKECLNRWQVGLADVGWNSLYWDNHDQPRAVSRFGNDHPDHWAASAKALALVLHLHRGTPYVYQGEELGMTNSPWASIDDFRDIESTNYYDLAVEAGREPDDILPGLRQMSRDNARTPVQWDASPNAGFTSGEPWIQVNPNYERLNAAAQYNDPDSVFNFYQRVIELRHRDPVIVDGSFEMLEVEHPQLYVYVRQLDNRRLLVAANLSNDPAEWSEPLGFVLLHNGGPLDPARLAPWEARLYELVGSPEAQK
ncbi:MAG: glycoside hydrolase family 13 protein [Arachnia sp.]